MNLHASVLSRSSPECCWSYHGQSWRRKRDFDVILQNVADAVLAIAYSANELHKRICSGRTGLCQEVSSMRGTNIFAMEVAEIMKNISFTGINGNTVSFDENQDGPAKYDVIIYNNTIQRKDNDKKWVKAAVYNFTETIWMQANPAFDNARSVCSESCAAGEIRKTETSTCCWQCIECLPNQYVAANGTQCVECDEKETPNAQRNACEPLPVRDTRYHGPENIASMALSVFGIIVTVIVAIILYVHQKTSLVMASSKELCGVMLLGSLICLTSTFAFVSPTNVASCAVSRAFLAIGPTLMYSALITKTVRVVIIFKSFVLSTQLKKYLSASYQVLTSLALTLVQGFILLSWFFLSPPETSLVVKQNEAFPACRYYLDLKVLIGMVYPLLLVIACALLATVNRKVPTGFNETFYIGFAMYSTCVIWLAFVAIFATNESNIPLKVATFSISLNLSAIVLIVSLFGYRCYVMVFKPESNTSENVMSVPRRSLGEVSSSESRNGRLSIRGSLQISNVKDLKVTKVEIK
ncbi:unnamed protein product [Clavelina lepadiformis]|uniref:G-protein coupled receptors family 3 profile domain-containing protein n=1 Tax=Clavelina lepadiformis TaxID=159417 RepID=A0ABP0GQV3_CLALP